MEKFNFWTDPYTQIHPFLPPNLRKNETTITWLLNLGFMILFSPVAILRLILIGFFFSLLWIVEKVRDSLPRPLLRLFHIILCRSILFILGFWDIESRYPQTKKKAQSIVPSTQVKNGDLIISNHVSYIDLLFLLYEYSPVFIYAPNYWVEDQCPKESNVQRLSFFSALSDVIKQPKRSKTECKETLEAVRNYVKKNNLGPLVFFPEGTTTNGEVLLGCSSLIKPLSKCQIDLKDVHILSFIYPNKSPIYTVGSFFLHIFKLCFYVSNQLRVQYIFEEDIVSVQESDDQTVEDKLLGLLASSSKIRKGKIMANKKHEFNEYWYVHKNEYKKNK